MRLWIRSNDIRDWDSFMDEVPEGEIGIARCVSLDSPEELNTSNLGRHWTTEDRWSSYGKRTLGSFPYGLYCLFGKTSEDNIEWNMSKDMFTRFEDEYELYVIDPSKVTDLRMFEVNPDCTLGREVTDEIDWRILWK